MRMTATHYREILLKHSLLDFHELKRSTIERREFDSEYRQPDLKQKSSIARDAN